VLRSWLPQLGMAAPTAWTKNRKLRTARLATLLSALQSIESLVPAFADDIAGPRLRWVLVAVLELWKALCRLRLLALGHPERLLLSTEHGDVDADVLAFRSSLPKSLVRSCFSKRLLLGAPFSFDSPQRQAKSSGRWPAALGLQDGYYDTALTTQSRWTILGEVMHIIQPLTHLAALLQLRNTPDDWFRTWRLAVMIEATSLLLCLQHVRRYRRQSGSCNEQNLQELGHRARLLVLLGLRPAMRALAREMLLALSQMFPRQSGAGAMLDRSVQLLDTIDVVSPRIMH